MLKLYGYWRSSCTWRVRIAMHFKQLPFKYVPVHLVKEGGEQHNEAYREKNPLAQVPVLEVESGGESVHLAQSMAILEFLEEEFPRPTILPDSPLERARVRQLSEIINAGTQPLQNLAVMQKLRHDYAADPVPWSTHWIERGLVAYETLATHTSGIYSVGDTVTMADLCLIPQLYNARRFQLDLADFPTILRIEEACMQLEAFIKASPENQPDAVI